MTVEGSEIATSFIYVSKVCQPYQLYVLEPANLCVKKCGIASQENLLVGTIWIGGTSLTTIVQKGIRCFLQLYTRSILSVGCCIPAMGLNTTTENSVAAVATGTERR